MAAFENHTDESIIDLFRDNDQAAFTELYDRYHKRAYGYILLIIKSPELTEDLVHEVFMKLWDRRERLEIKGSFSAYLFRACHNAAVDAVKAIAKDRSRIESIVEYYETIASEPAAELNQYGNIVEEALSSLTPQRRAVYQLCKQEGKTYREAAAQLGLSVHTVKDHLSNAIADLRRFIREKGELAVLMFIWENIS